MHESELARIHPLKCGRCTQKIANPSFGPFRPQDSCTNALIVRDELHTLIHE